MEQVRHGSATTTHAVRAAIQRSQASPAQLSRELDINPKTVAKWRKRASVEDMKTGPKEPRQTTRSQKKLQMRPQPVNGGVKSGHVAAQKSATLGNRRAGGTRGRPVSSAHQGAGG